MCVVIGINNSLAVKLLDDIEVALQTNGTQPYRFFWE